ncbi:LPXTG cell wall anchor domain-containing protein, partial [Streptococcus thermophilus]
DLDFTLVYAKNAPAITTESKTINETIHYVYKDGTTTPENPTEDTPITYVPVPQPVRPTDNGDNNGTPTTAAQPASPSTPQYMDGQRELPNTGTEDNASLAALGLLGVLSGFGLVARKKKED